MEDEERDTSAWLGNELQNEAFEKLYALEKNVLASGSQTLISDFGKLQESDHFYYMCTKFFSDGAVHKYFNPYNTPYEAFINYMNVLSDFEIRVKKSAKGDVAQPEKTEAEKVEKLAASKPKEAVAKRVAVKKKMAKAMKPAEKKKKVTVKKESAESKKKVAAEKSGGGRSLPPEHPSSV
jgi:alpha-amylase